MKGEEDEVIKLYDIKNGLANLQEKNIYDSSWNLHEKTDFRVLLGIYREHRISNLHTGFPELISIPSTPFSR